MIVVSDASPLISLTHVGRLGLLRDLYGHVVIPEAVYREVVGRADRPGAGEVEQVEWITVRQVVGRGLADALRNELGPGESEAIVLASESPGSLLLLDEYRARKVAARLGVEIIGVVGVLTEAKRRGLVTGVKPVLDDLVRIAGFRISQALYERVLDQEGERPTSS